MIKVEYGLPKRELNKRYLQLFDTDLSVMDHEWKQIHENISYLYPNLNYSIPSNIQDLLIADFPTLVDIFLSYLKFKNLPRDMKDAIIILFDYKKFQPKIAGFFMDTNNKFQIHVCHYCGTAYINAYGILTSPLGHPKHFRIKRVALLVSAPL